MQERDFTKATGSLLVQVFGADGVEKDRQEINNLVVTVGKNFIASRMAGASAGVMSHMSIGTATAAPVLAKTILGTEIGRVALTSGVASSNAVTYVADFPAGIGTGAITEAGIFNAPTAGTMLCCTVFPVVNKGAADSISITWVVTIN